MNQVAALYFLHVLLVSIVLEIHPTLLFLMSLGMMEACCNKREREKACVCCACEPDVIIPLCMCVRSVMRTRFVGLFAMCFVMCVCICRMIICFLTILLTGSCIKLLTSILFFHTHIYDLHAYYCFIFIHYFLLPSSQEQTIVILRGKRDME